MSAYPTRPQSENGWQIFGNAANQIGQAVGQFGDNQNRLQLLMQDMAEKRMTAELAKRKLAKDAEEEANKKAYEDFSNGAIVSPTLAGNAALAQASTKPVTPAQAELSDLSNVQGMTMPGQKISAGQSADDLMNAAAMATPTDMANGRTMPTRAEKIAKAASLGLIDPAKEAELTDPWKNVDPMTRAMMMKQGGLAAVQSPSRSAFLGAVANAEAEKTKAGKHFLKADIVKIAHDVDPTGSIFDDPAYQRTIEAYSTAIPAFTANQNQLTNDERDYWAQQYADGKVDPQFLSGLFSSRGGNKAEVMADITKRAQAINGNVDLAADITGAKTSRNTGTQKVIAAIDNVKSRMDHILDLSNKVDRTRFPTLNDWLISGERGTGNVNAELLALNQDLMGEELSPVFGQGAAASDAKLHLAQQVSAISRLSPELAAQKIEELKGALEARRTSYTNLMGRFAPKTPGADKPSPAPTSPKDAKRAEALRRKYNY